MKKLSIILIVIGLIAVASPFVGRLYTQYQENRLMAEWLSSDDGETTVPETSASVDPAEGFGQLQEAFAADNTNKDTAQTTEPDGVDNTAATTAKPAAANAVKQTVLGVITIDKIKLKYPIVEGVKPENLRAGIGHIPGTAALGQNGNSALAGHRNYTFGKFFNRLDELQVGDKITLSTKKSNYRYIVYEKLVVTPDDVSVIKGSKDDNIITLITCTPIYIATHRLIIHARLESSTAMDP